MRHSVFFLPDVAPAVATNKRGYYAVYAKLDKEVTFHGVSMVPVVRGQHELARSGSAGFYICFINLWATFPATVPPSELSATGHHYAGFDQPQCRRTW